MKKILVVDDELLSRQKILRFLKMRSEEFNIREAANGIEALNEIESFQPDVVFLDIEMPEMNGMDLIQAVREPQFQLIFQTAYSEFAVQAFEKNALDYLLKPYNQERFFQALDRALNQSVKPNSLDGLSEKMSQDRIYLSKIIVKKNRKNTLIPTEEIFWFRSENHYTYACTAEFDHIFSEPLKDLANKLNPDQFMQVHRNAIVNTSQIKSVIQGDNMKLVLTNGVEVPVSRSNKKIIKEKILMK